MSHVKVSCLALLVILGLACSVYGGKANRSYVAGNYFLTLDGVKCGFLKSVDGGGISAEVINEAVGPDYITKKHIGKPKYEAYAIQVGFNMGKPLYDWIQQSWTQKYRRLNGSIVATNADYDMISEQQFFNALITETTIPAMDGGSKEPAYITIKFSPEYTRPGKPGGKGDMGGPAKGEQKMFLPHNFKLEIEGLDCAQVSRIESFTVKQSAVQDDIGDSRDQVREPGKLEFPNLKVTLSERTAQSWFDWHQNFVINGNNSQPNEKKGSLTLYSPNMKEVLLTIRFHNMGIFRLQAEKSEPGSEAIRRVRAEMYVERMEFIPGPAGVASDSTNTPDNGATPTSTTKSPARELMPAGLRTPKRPG